MKMLGTLTLSLLLFFVQTLVLAETLTVAKLHGPAFLLNGAAKQALKENETFEVKEGSSIQTEKNSDLILIKKGDFGVKVYSNTTLSLAAPKNKKAKDAWELTLTRGAALLNVKNPKHAPDHLRLKTRAATLGVRGTTFYARDIESKPVFFCPCKGEIQMIHHDNGKVEKTFISKHHDEPSDLTVNQNHQLEISPTQQQPEHSDEEIEALVSSI